MALCMVRTLHSPTMPYSAGRVAEAMQRKELRQFALSAALQLAAALCGTAAAAKMAPAANGSAGSKSRNGTGTGTGVDLRLRLLPAVHVLLLWVASHPEAARCCAVETLELHYPSACRPLISFIRPLLDVVVTSQVVSDRGAHALEFMSIL